MPLEPLRHVLDDDACCIYCGFDAAEEYHLRVHCVPKEAREPMPYFAKFCSKRPAGTPDFVGRVDFGESY